MIMSDRVRQIKKRYTFIKAYVIIIRFFSIKQDNERMVYDHFHMTFDSSSGQSSSVKN
jgi:hypothetical protein